ncbi:MAG: hypothetical protein F9K34_13860 [Albidovulum sp.]|uniref:hypothetical protein n=1 Tax=Albidovulum sp. TaxID=1872424 RepID=UPI00132ADF65|nr:hypothetical protein [Defluviimonas sp.]KAB2882675.1 MAG: hypothetical protein F9K34_13860 [Defluviimonas sp.]
MRALLAVLPALVAGGLLHGPALRAEIAARQAEAEPLESLAAAVPSRTFNLAHWRGEARVGSTLWRAAVVACAGAAFHDQPNCLSVAAARHLERVP